MQNKKIILSAIQPTGMIHLGNYLGFVKNFVYLQNKYQNHQVFCAVADLHSLTNMFQADHTIKFKTNLSDQTYDMTAYLLASGFDMDRTCLFLQSLVPQHIELQWILSCIAPMNWLNLMTQFKDKKTKTSSLGLFSYPVLMAADILLYKADIVPVGKDQRQHLELTQDYAKRFNLLFSKNDEPFFKSLEFLDVPNVKVMSLRDGTKKMSKSERSEYSRIDLNDNPTRIYEKIMKSKTDSLQTIKYDEKNRPEVSNLIGIYQLITNQKILEIEQQFENKTTQDFKEDLAQKLIKEIYPIHLKAQDLLEDKQYLKQILLQNSEFARSRAEQNMKDIKKLIGLFN